MKRKCLALLVGAMVFFGGTGALMVSANTLKPTINGISFSAYSNISGSSASAGTVSTSSDLQVSVSSTYNYVNTNTLVAGTMQDSASRKAYATVSFQAPANCISVKIHSSHDASSGSETWSGTTEAILGEKSF